MFTLSAAWSASSGSLELALSRDEDLPVSGEVAEAEIEPAEVLDEDAIMRRSFSSSGVVPFLALLALPPNRSDAFRTKLP